MDESGFITAYGGGSGTTFADVVSYVIGIANSLIVVLAGLALLLFLWGVFKYIYTAGAKKDRKAIMWSLVALFVLFSIWGILRLACNSLLPGGTCGSSGSSGTLGGTGGNLGPNNQGLY